MAFDWKNFAGSFLSEVTEDIQERTRKAEDYEKERKALAARNLSVVREREANAQRAAQLGRQAMAYGATKEQVIAAMSTGINGVADLTTKLQELHKQAGLRPEQTLTKEEIDIGISMDGIPAIDPSLIALDIENLARRTYGAERLPTEAPTTEEQPSFMRSLFALDAKDAVDRKLKQEKYYGGMSVSDINFLARQNEYQSLYPEATMTFANLPKFNASAKADFNKDVVSAINNSVKAGKDTIAAARTLALSEEGVVVDGKKLSADEAEVRARKELQIEAARTVIEKYAEQYEFTGFFDDETVKDMIIKINQLTNKEGDKSGIEYYQGLLKQFNIEIPEDQLERSISEADKDPKAKKKNANESKEANTAVEKETLSTKERIKANVYYRNDEGNVVKGVPPRPTLSLMTMLGGQGLGGDDIEEILDGKMPVPQNLRPGQWDELFGATHNPDGTPKE